MASAADLPRSLRRAAARRLPARGRPPSPTVQAAADAGLLTRANTAPGTAGRRAVDRATYRRRRSAEPELSAREAAGHRVAGTRTRVATFFTDGPPRLITISDPSVTLRDVRRAGAYMGDVGALLADLSRASGRPSEIARVKRAWGARMRRRAPIAGYRVLATADAAIALADELRGDEDESLKFDSGRSRPGRRRRSTRRAR